MKKASVLLLIIVSLIMASFAGIGVPRASAATVGVSQVTVTPSIVNATNVTVSVQFTTSVDVPINGTVSVLFDGQIISDGSESVSFTPSSVTGTAVAVGATSTITVTLGTDLPHGTYVLQLSGSRVKNPSSPGNVFVRIITSAPENLGYGKANIAGSIANLAVYPSSTVPGAASSYAMYFDTSSALTTSDKIFVQFQYSAPAPTGVVTVNETNTYATVSGTTVTVSMPVAVSAGGRVRVTLPITNPSAIGMYYVLVSTTIDTTPVQSNQYQITGTSVSRLSLTVDPKAQSAAAQFTVTFTTSSTGALQANSGTILIDFPSSITLPSSISASLVTVNGSPAYYVLVTSDGIVHITTPVNITASQQITVTLSKNIGIANPASTGITVTVAVSTSADVAPVSSSYTTITSQVTQPQVQLTSNGAGSVAGYTIGFNIGAAGSLRANYDTITVVFPSGTALPNSISRDLVKVNNYVAAQVRTSGNRIDITPAMNATANAPIQIVIDKTANIKNPATAQAYTLQVSTSVEVTLVTSAAYTIVNLPKTLIIVSPAAPDGLAGFYKTRPTVVLAATSPVDSSPVVYYSINGGTQQTYTTPFQLPDGNVTLTYYARDRQGNQEDPQTFTAKVDATPPAATILSPAQGAVVGTSPVTVTGKVAPGMQVSVAGSSVMVAATGDFSASVPLKEGPQTVVFTVTSVSGNIGQTQLVVTLDTTPPVLTITKPVMYSTVLTSICEVSGKTEPGAIVKVAGSVATVNADGTFASNVMLKEGDNLIEITATDAVGNQRKTAIPVTYKARTVIHLQVGNKTAMVNDAKNTLQAAPVNIKGVVMVPLRFIGEAFGATVTWDPVFQIIDINLKGSLVRLQLGTNYASVAGKKVILQGIPVSMKGVTMVPIRFISEAFGAQVDWIAATQGIDITYPKP